MKVIIASILWTCAAFGSERQPQQYSGEFSYVNSTGQICDEIFQVKRYDVSFYFSGPSSTTAVVHFSSPANKGFLNNLTQVGLYGGMGDFKADKQFVLGQYQYGFVAEGDVGAGFLVFKETATVKKVGTSEPVCTATAEYSGF